MNNLTKLYQIQELTNTPELDEYIQTLIKIEKEYERQKQVYVLQRTYYNNKTS